MTTEPSPASSPHPSRHDALHLLGLLVLVVLIGAPALTSGAFLAHADSELPVRLWAFSRFEALGPLGGSVPELGFPRPGPLNNPDPLGTTLMTVLRPLLGEARGYDVLVLGTVYANMLAAWVLARRVFGDAWAASLAAVGIGLAPVVVSYCVTGAITDMLHLWPWLLAVLALHAAMAPEAGSRRAWSLGAAAGGLAALGFVISPYNLVIALGGGVPGAGLALFGMARAEGSWRAPLRRAVRVGAGALLAGGLVAGPWALALRGIMDDPSSQMSSNFVASTRHAPPWRTLLPDHPASYAATLDEYVATDASAIKERDVGSHYARTTAIPWVLLVLAGVGAIFLPGVSAGRWTSVALWGALASTGPFLLMTRTLYLVLPVNPAYLAVYHGLGGRMIFEVFRYGVVAVIAVSMAAAATVATLRRRGGTWRLVGPLAVAGVLAQLGLASPVRYPLPTASPVVSDAYARIDALLGPGAVLELPFFDRGTGRFARVHFLNQRVHGRTIADEVKGFPPTFLLHNPATNNLLAAEDARTHFRFEARPEGREDAGLRALVDAGFAGIVVDPAGYATPEALEVVRRILKTPPIEVGDRLVWVLKGPDQAR